MKNQPRSNWTGWGMEWTADVTPIAAMVWLIRNNGQGKDTKGNPVQVPLFGLYRQLQSELWPEDDHHEWSDLMLRTMVAERITAVQGGKDSSKTHTMAKFALTDYLCFPEQTLSLMSSTDLRGLELRVWGDLKDLFTRARDKWPEIPGHPVDHMHGIFTDDLSEERDIRDIRKGLLCIPMLESGGSWKGLEKYTGIKQKRRRLFGDECFPKGTLVDTPMGPRKIETLKAGDSVVNAIGVDVIKGVLKTKADSLCKITLKDGRAIVCTPDHSFLTQRGWEKAIDISCSHYMVSAYEAMRILRGELPTNKQQQGMSRVQRETNQGDVQILPSHIHQNPPEWRRYFLQSELLKQMEPSATGISSEFLHSRAGEENNQGEVKVAQRTPGIRRLAISCVVTKQSHERKSSHAQEHSIEDSLSWWETIRSNSIRSSAHVHASSLRTCSESANSNRIQVRECDTLQNRRCTSEIKTGRGSRWQQSPHSQGESQRCEKGYVFEGGWVDSCTILKPSDFETTTDSSGRIEVYNLHVEKHHSYSVNGCIALNCQFMQPPYLTALANLNKGNFKGVFVGNPIGEGDPLDKLAEPLEGWDSLPEVTKTSTWKNRMGGTTINLVGSDSPAIRHPGKYPYLIDQSDIDYIVGYWGRDSAEYWNQAEGVRRPGVSLRRVVTRDMVNKFGAQDEVVWSVKPTIKGYAIDASYGGDRCIGGPFEFGADINGHQVISFGKPKVIPIKIYPKNTPEDQRILPEDQIAEYAKADCEALSIPSANVFHDATGRGSLGSAFARLWRHDTNPIEFGGSATPRPVLSDLFIYDEKLKQKRLKRCDEHYSKFVSELWFSVRYVIEGRQSRNLPNEAVDELCAREWKRVRGDRIEVESKEDMKPRFGRSPDIGDWVSIAVEGARRLGFQITRMGWELPKQEKDEKWKEELRERARKSKQAYSLTYR